MTLYYGATEGKYVSERDIEGSMYFPVRIRDEDRIIGAQSGQEYPVDKGTPMRLIRGVLRLVPKLSVGDGVLTMSIDGATGACTHVKGVVRELLGDGSFVLIRPHGGTGSPLQDIQWRTEYTLLLRPSKERSEALYESTRTQISKRYVYPQKIGPIPVTGKVTEEGRKLLDEVEAEAARTRISESYLRQAQGPSLHKHKTIMHRPGITEVEGCVIATADKLLEVCWTWEGCGEQSLIVRHSYAGEDTLQESIFADLQRVFPDLQHWSMEARRDMNRDYLRAKPYSIGVKEEPAVAVWTKGDKVELSEFPGMTTRDRKVMAIWNRADITFINALPAPKAGEEGLPGVIHKRFNCTVRVEGMHTTSYWNTAGLIRILDDIKVTHVSVGGTGEIENGVLVPISGRYAYGVLQNPEPVLPPEEHPDLDGGDPCRYCETSLPSKLAVTVHLGGVKCPHCDSIGPRCSCGGLIVKHHDWSTGEYLACQRCGEKA